MKFREHRAGLDESMATTVFVEDIDSLLAHIRRLAESWPSFPPITRQSIHIKPYGGMDERIGWDTYIVTLDGYGVLGFTDGVPTNR